MPWKTDKITVGEEEKEILVRGKNGHPVWQDDDQSESEVAWDVARKKINDLVNGELAQQKKAQELEKNLQEFQEKFKGIEDPVAAIKALNAVKNMSDKKLIDAGEVDKVKEEIRKVYEDKTTSLEQKLVEAEKVYKETLQGKEAQIYQLLVSQQFAHSPFIREKTIYTPAKLEKIYGDHFKVEDGQCVGYLNGKKIYSRKNPGEFADFEEALSMIIEADPERDNILKGAQHSGGGSEGGAGGTGGKQYNTLADFTTREEKLDFIKNHGQEAWEKLVARSVGKK